MSTSSSKHDPGGSAIPTPRIQRLAVKDVIDAPRISRSSVPSPTTRTRKPLPANTRAGHTAVPNLGFPDVVCWCTKQWSCKTVPDHRRDREELFANSPSELINPTAIARTYSSTESMRGTATQHPWTSASCLPSPNASPQKPEYDRRPRKDPDAMMHVRHAPHARIGSATGCGTYSTVEPGVGARSQSFSQSVSVLRRIMLESHRAPMTARPAAEQFGTNRTTLPPLSDLSHWY